MVIARSTTSAGQDTRKYVAKSVAKKGRVKKNDDI
jgi:hypothetical protein